ncbi:TetR/AcrR family transcriptional regulator [Zooshikella harenae]|uniref:TetR/AcrR family transcriptional regulator n=1 Tax=Zooshikella harenae TaxID=2827238 RepID=A0ABS5ZH10_9GAMM|nr:TetR/AcrR family transcriptional regulator [Zooshikella harenae]MBU2713346.1 TetR/AcrR family transcriptional regulator [Zooshikella harenae]
MNKREKLIQTAFELFYQYGIHAVGINQILKESGIAKKTLYSYFESKEQLVCEVVSYRDRIFMDWLKMRLNDVGQGLPAIETLFDALDDWFNSRVDVLMDFRGCFFINACAEYCDHEVNRRCFAHKEKVSHLIEQHARKLNISDDSVAIVTEELCFLKEGAISQAYVLGDLDAAKKAKKIALKLIPKN